jgi:hypothetical protein
MNDPYPYSCFRWSNKLPLKPPKPHHAHMQCGKVCSCCGRKCTRQCDHAGYCGSPSAVGIPVTFIFYGVSNG